MILFLYGEESYRIHERLKALRLGFVKKYDALGLSETMLEGEDITLDTLSRALHSGGLFTKKRLIIVKNPVQTIRDSETRKAVLELLKGVTSEDTVVIVVEMAASARGRNALWTYLTKLPHAEKFDVLAPPKRTAWILATAKKRGGAIEPHAADELSRRVGEDLWRLSGEIDKLLAYANGRMIALADVSLFLEQALDENVFHLTDALGDKNAKRALQLVDEQLALGTAPLALLASLTWQWKNMVRVKRRRRQGMSVGKLASELALHPFVAEKTSRQVERFTLEELRVLTDELVAIDRKLKSTSEDAGLLFDLFVVRACAMSKA
ncbi:MAG: DNA polymerase III subunit delta [Candidatus Kerfeldbacteria bacterium]|nr:DNA polymerase III subunit delta [Candidatus Kerfeldbacteria bacterium]